MSGLFEGTADPDTGSGADEAGAVGVDPLDGLNDAQRDAATHSGGPLIVLAGPGTGKTRVIVARIAHLVRNLGVDPGSVLALTFTNKAAGEMRERLSSMLGPVAAESVRAFTFNGFGAHVLRRFSDLAGLPRDPDLIDGAQRRRMMREIIGERGMFRSSIASGMDGAIDEAVSLIGSMHNAALSPVTASDRIASRRAELRASLDRGGDDSEVLAWRGELARADRLAEVVALWEAFDRACLDRGLIGYDDQLSRTNGLLARSEAARSIVRADHRHLVVDEFQDVNAAQIEMLRLVAPPDAYGGAGPDLCVVGDDDQAIYAFRGADDRAFEKFASTWPGARTVMLDENYRSATPVLSVAASVISRAHRRFEEDKTVRRAESAGADPAGSVVEAVRLENFRQADEVIASMIKDAVRSGDGGEERGAGGARLGRFAVIARTWGELERIRGALEVEGIPTRTQKGAAPVDDAGVLDVLAWIDLLLHPEHTWSARRLLRRPPFQVRAETVASIERAYRAARSRDRGLGPFPAWAAGPGAEGLGERERALLSRFAALDADLRARVLTLDASSAIAEIVRRTGVVHADLLDGRARAARVSAVVGLMRFAAERLGRLDPPGDLGAFVAYREDLRRDEADLVPGVLDEEPAEAPGGDADAVHLISAHGAKGLEYDTVFIPRVESKDGYPSIRAPDEATTLPDWLTGDPAKDRASIEDEERRLFYVACTRAERRLVLLGKVPKATKSVNFMVELLGEGGLVVELEAGDVLGDAGGDDAERAMRPLRFDASTKRREALRTARRLARLEAAAALDSSDEAGLDEAGLGSVSERLAAAARTLAAVARAEAGDELPAWLDDPALREVHRSIVAGAEEGPNVPALSALRPMPAPLRLSFTAIDQWERCPLCFYTRYVLEAPEPEGEPLVVGQVVHRALEWFYAGIKSADEAGGAIPHPTLDGLLRRGGDLFDEAWDEGSAIDHGQRDRALEMLRICHDRLHHESINVEGVEKQFGFVFEHNGAHRISGKIDRLDVTGGGYRIVDYKTGNPSKRLLEPGKDDLQLGIYALALRAFVNGGEIDGHGPPAGTAEYWVLATGERGVISLDDLAEKEPKVRERIGKAIDGMLSGAYRRGSKCSGLCGILLPGGEPGGDAGG